MRNSIPHPKNDFEGIRSHNPTKLLYALVQKYNVLMKRKKKKTFIDRQFLT